MKTIQHMGSLRIAAFVFMFLIKVATNAQTGVYSAGTNAGTNNTTGDRNTFVGYEAGYTNVTGNDNSFLGYQAGYVNIGNYNTFIGRSAGAANTSANSNTFVGTNAGALNTTGAGNCFMGAFTGRNTTTGGYNSFFGNSPGYYNTTGAHNNFIGNEAGFYNTTGNYNCFEGSESGYNNTSGNYNSYLGYQAGYSNATGFSNTFLGYRAGRYNTGSINCFVGVTSGYLNTTGHYNTYVGNGAGYTNTTGWRNVAVGIFAGYDNLGGNNTFIGYNSSTPVGATFTNATAIGNQSYVSAANSLVLGSINGVNGATADVNVGIGTSAPAYRLQLGTGDAAKPGTSTWIIASDQRLKKDISAFTDGLAVLQKIKPVWFRYNGEAGLPQNTRYVGVIAQEMQQIAPYTIGQFVYQDTTGKKTHYLDYDANALTYILVNSVKEQQKQLQEKDAQIAAIQKELAELKTLLTKAQSTLSFDKESGQARLWQNAPNPYDHTTVIQYFVPPTARKAAIQVFNANGQQVGDYAINTIGQSELMLTTNHLATGTYVYKLIVDGVSMDSKKLVVAR